MFRVHLSSWVCVVFGREFNFYVTELLCLQNEGEDNDPGDTSLRTHVRGLPSSVAVAKPGVVRWGYCVKQGNVVSVH